MQIKTMPTILKRLIVCAAGAMALLAQIAPATASNTSPSDIVFDVKARGIRGGQFVVEEQIVDGQRVIDVTAKLKFKLGFITLKKVDHKSHEVWQDGKLLTLQSRTRKDGGIVEVTAEAHPDCLLVNSSEKGVLQMSLEDTSPTSFTKPGLFSSEEPRNIDLLDTLNGFERPSRIQFVERQQIKIKKVLTDVRYFIVHERDNDRLTHEFWIDDSDLAMKILLHTEDGTTVQYTYAG